MAESIFLSEGATKAERYEQLIPQLKTLIGDDSHQTAVMSNCASAIHFASLWTGFYTVEGDELLLGPFQGPIACMRIKIGKGVSGAVLANGESLVVPDVDAFPGHIACSSDSRSEIVVPVRDAAGKIRAVLDFDSASLSTYDETDRAYLETICDWIGAQIF